MTDLTPNSLEPGVLDVQGALDRIAGDESLLGELSEIFLKDAPPILSELHSALEAHNSACAERKAHALKGIAANVGGVRVERAALAVEDAARSNQMELAGIAANALTVEMQRLICVLRQTGDGPGVQTAQSSQ